MPKKEKTETKERKKVCPFDRTLECEDCRLFQVFHGGVGEPICSVVRIAAWMPF